MTIPNDDNKPDQAAGGGAVPPTPDAAGSVPPAAPEQPVTPPAPPAPDATYPPAPPAAYPPAPSAAGAPGAFPSYAATPPAPVAAPTAPPSIVNTAFWLYIAAAVLSVISGIVTIISVNASRQSVFDSLQRTGNLPKGVTAQQALDTYVAGATALSIVTLIFWAVTFVLFAIIMGRGANWARIVLTILTVISLVNIPWGFFSGALQVIAAIVATVLIWLKPASAYFAAVKASKAPRA